MFKNSLHRVRATLPTISVAEPHSMVQMSSVHRKIRF